MNVDPVSALPSRPSPEAAGARLGELYAAHARMVYGICRMLLRDADEAEDATQQVFLSAYRSLLTGTEVQDPAAWLGTIARNACRRRATERTHEPFAVGGDVTLVSPAAEDAAIGREDAAALYAQLAVLPDKQREAVLLRDVFGLRYDEVATALGTSRPAVEALLFRGRRRLQRRLRPDLVAGAIVVPLALRESLAYAVPGFAGVSAPASAAAASVGIPLAAKLAAGGSALALVGSAGVAAERALHDPPARPAEAPPEAVDVAAEERQPLLLVPGGGGDGPRPTDDGPARAVAAPADDDDEGERGDGEEGSGRDGRDERDEPERDEPERDEPDRDEPDREDRLETAADEVEEHEDSSGPGGGDARAEPDGELGAFELEEERTGEESGSGDSGSGGGESADD